MAAEGGRINFMFLDAPTRPLDPLLLRAQIRLLFSTLADRTLLLYIDLISVTHSDTMKRFVYLHHVPGGTVKRHFWNSSAFKTLTCFEDF